MDLAAEFLVVAVNDGVADDFCHGSFGIVRKFFAVVGFFPPALVRIVSYECDGILQLADYAAFQFGLVIVRPFQRVQKIRDW